MIKDTVVNIPTLLRPQNFDDIIGQKFAQGVGKQIGKGIISGQGYLLTGPKGCGKTTTARIIAKAVNCENRDDRGNPCNNCKQCLSANNNINPNIREINAARNRGIGEVKELLSSIRTGVREGYLVVIFDEAHQLTKEAFSALLKPIEEHADNIIFIMTTTNPEGIPDTIVSRMNIIPMIPLGDEDMELVLNNAIENGIKQGMSEWENVSPEDIKYAISSASGSPRQGLTTLSGIIVHGVSQSSSMGDIDAIVNGFMDGNVIKVLSEVSNLLEQWETPDIHFLINSIIDTIVKNMKNNNVDNPIICANTVTNLAKLSGDITNFNQSSVMASKIASCVVPYDSVKEDAVHYVHNNNHDGKDNSKINRKSQVENTTSNNKKDRPSKPSEVEPVRKLKITETTDLDKLVYLLLNNDKFSNYIDDELYALLNDENSSELFFDNGSFYVKVLHDGDVQSYYNSLSKIISNVVVIGKDVWDVSEDN